MKRLVVFLILINIFNVFSLPVMKLISGGKYIFDGTEINQEDFFISETKITVAQWKEYLNEINKASDDYFKSNMQRLVDNRTFEIKDNYPVWGLTYLQIVDFCNWLSKKNKLNECYSTKTENGRGVVGTNYNANGYRLPTLREWYYVSELWMNKESVYYEDVNILKGESIFEREYPYEVDCEKYNGFGIKDPLGNIYEFCNDYYLEGQNLKLLKTNKYGPVKYTPDSDQIYFKEQLTAVYILVGGSYNNTYQEVKERFVRPINCLSSEFCSFRVVKNK